MPNTLNLCPKPKNWRRKSRIEHEKSSYSVSQSESSTKKPFNFANQSDRVLRQPSRRPIKIDYYVTRELEDLSRLWARVGSLEPVLKHEGLPAPLPAQLTFLLLFFLIESSSTKAKFSIGILVEQIKFIVVEK